MEWWALLIIFFSALMVLFVLGLPVPFSFLLLVTVGGWVFWGGPKGVTLIVGTMFESVKNYNLTTIISFMLMGIILFRSGLGTILINAVDKWIGRVPGRLSLIGVAAGVLIGALSGSGGAAVALLGAVLIPEMQKRGYNKTMLLGPIMGAGGLAVIIPPSGLAVLLGSVADIPIGPLLISGFMPGFLIAALIAGYIIIRCWLQPELAPASNEPSAPLSVKLTVLVRDILPFGIIIFLVMGLILLGVASPNESAATGVVGAIILALAYKGMNWKIMYHSLGETVRTSLVLLMIFTGSVGFSQLLSFSGAARGLVAFSTSFDVSPFVILIFMQIGILILGCFIDSVSIIMITMPIYMPIVRFYNFDPVWFGMMSLINIEVGGRTPPFGMTLFLMKGLAPEGTTMWEIIRSVFPIVLIDIAALILIMIFPQIALWLPSVTKR